MEGYRQMLRDRMPQMLDLALRYCKAKKRWIDYVYDTIVKKHPQNQRSTVVKMILGIKQKYKRSYIYDQIRYVELKPITKEQVQSIPKSELYMRFSDTIDWTTLSCKDPNMYRYWEVVAEWIDWFSKNYSNVYDTYDHARSWNIPDSAISRMLSQKYTISENLSNFLIKSFKEHVS